MSNRVKETLSFYATGGALYAPGNKLPLEGGDLIGPAVFVWHQSPPVTASVRPSLNLLKQVSSCQSLVRTSFPLAPSCPDSEYALHPAVG